MRFSFTALILLLVTILIQSFNRGSNAITCKSLCGLVATSVETLIIVFSSEARLVKLMVVTLIQTLTGECLATLNTIEI